MLIGEYTHSLDPKGRLIMPAKFREDIGSHFYVTIGTDKCLRAYSFEEWNKYKAKIEALPDSDNKARQYKRAIFANSNECEVDKQGRILIASNLKNYAGLEKDVIIIGQSSYIEIWGIENWNSYNETQDINLDELVSGLSDYGL